MRKLLLPAAGLAALSLLLGACGTPITPYAAQVGRATIASSTLTDAMRSIAKDTGYRCEVLSGSTAGGTQLAIEGSGSSSFASSFAADVLTQLVQYRATSDAVARLGLAPSGFARQLAAAQLPSALAPSSTSGCATTGAAVLSGFSDAYRRLVDTFELDQLLLLGHAAGVPITRSAVAAYAASHAAISALSCTSVIEVASKAAASAAARQIAAGASFATVASRTSTDASAARGGALGCIFPSQFASPLSLVVAALAPGKVSPPVPFGTNYLLLEVTSRRSASLAQVAGQIVLGQEAKFPAMLSAAIDSVHVSVDPAYGTWRHTAAGWGVAAPAGPPDALLPDPVAVTPIPATAQPG